MPSPVRAPEQIIRDWLDQNGSTRVDLEALEQTWGIERFEPADRRRIAEALDGAGVDIDPPLQRVSRSEKLTLSVRQPAVEPPVNQDTPAAEPETPPLSPAAERQSPPPPRRRRRRPRSLLNRNRVAAPPPAQSSTVREDALRADAAREQARAAREQERERARAEAAEQAERERAEREREEAQARDDRERERLEEEARATEQREREEATAEDEYRRERDRVEAAKRHAEAQEAAAAEPEPVEPSQPVSRAMRGVAAAGVVLMVLGSLGPWAKALFVTDYGVDRSGTAVIIAALVAATLLFLHIRRGRESWLPLVTAGVGAFAGALVAGDFRDLLDDPFVSPAWGLYMAFVGSVVVVGFSMTLLVRRR